jgi:3,4-dihydroxy 2-butanone 4-phosphate synthase/GTP cyclohydrolase II
LFGDYTTGREHTLLVYGDFNRGSLGNGKNVLIRMHSSCATSELFHANNCECRQELIAAMKRIRREGREQ